MEKKRFRQKDDDSSSEDEVVIRKKLPKENEEITIVEEVSEIDRDLAERDAFVQRLLVKDEKKTAKQQVEVVVPSVESELLDSKASKLNTVDMLREMSRQHYLEKREQRELKILEMQLKDEEELFEGEALTKEEVLDFWRQNATDCIIYLQLIINIYPSLKFFLFLTPAIGDSEFCSDSDFKKLKIGS